MKIPSVKRGPPVAESGRAIRVFHSSRAGLRTILLISEDRTFCEDLRSFANVVGFLLVQAKRSAGTVAILQATRPSAVLLDLDFPDEAAWQIAELVLCEPGCPVVILVTARTAQFDMKTAARAGSLVNKNEPASDLLQIVKQAIEMPAANQQERNAIQRVLLGRLRPSWSESTSPSYRFWGINE